MKTVSDAAVVRRYFAASPERVFSAFSNGNLVARWLRPDASIGLTLLEFDFRIGGRYRLAYHVPDGTTMVVGGVYRAIDRPSAIVFSWLIEPPDEHAGIESEVTVAIAPTGAGSELHIRHEKFGRADATTRHAEGWAGAFELLDQLLAAAPDAGET
jgi:uncharacterized protein YndB with AHSA1/START domain